LEIIQNQRTFGSNFWKDLKNNRTSSSLNFSKAIKEEPASFMKYPAKELQQIS
jgi:hypothetical protein